MTASDCMLVALILGYMLADIQAMPLSCVNDVPYKILLYHQIIIIIIIILVLKMRCGTIVWKIYLAVVEK